MGENPIKDRRDRTAPEPRNGKYEAPPTGEQGRLIDADGPSADLQAGRLRSCARERTLRGGGRPPNQLLTG